MKNYLKCDFESIYNELYNKYFNYFENIRKKEKSSLFRAILCGIFILTGLSFLDTDIEMSNINNIFSLLFFAIAVCIFISLRYYHNLDYTQLYKEKVIRNFMNNILPDIEYIPNPKIDECDNIINIYRSANFSSKKFNRSSIDDVMVGQLDNLYINICDLITNYEYYIKDEHHKECNIRILDKFQNSSEYEKTILLDNDEFNKNFIVLANSDIEAFELLTSDVIEFLNNQYSNNDTKFDISIKNNTIYFRFYTVPIFEPSLDKPGMRKDFFKRYYDLLNFIFNFSKKIDKLYKDSLV